MVYLIAWNMAGVWPHFMGGKEVGLLHVYIQLNCRIGTKLTGVMSDDNLYNWDQYLAHGENTLTLCTEK